jgi:hypothetical protein
MSLLKKGVSLGGLLTVLFFTSTAAVAAEDDTGKVSGYLGPDIYAMLEEVEAHEGFKVKRWIGPKLSFANYKKVLVEPVILYPEPEPGPQVSQETLDKVITYLTEKLSDKIGAVLNLSDEPGPDVLRIQAAITGVTVTTEGMKAYEVVPVAAVFGGLKALTGNRNREVIVFLEIKISDSESGEMVGAAVRRIEGEKLAGKREQLELEHLKGNLDSVGDDAESAIIHMMEEQK